MAETLTELFDQCERNYRALTPSLRAQRDQQAAALVDDFASHGLDLRDPAVRRAALVTAATYDERIGCSLMVGPLYAIEREAR